MNIKLSTPAAVAAALAGLMATAPVLAADYVQAPGSVLVFATKYDGEVFTGSFPGFDTKLSFDIGTGYRLEPYTDFGTAVPGMVAFAQSARASPSVRDLSSNCIHLSYGFALLANLRRNRLLQRTDYRKRLSRNRILGSAARTRRAAPRPP